MDEMNQQQASDTDLIREVLAGNNQSYAILLGRYQHMVFTLAVRMLRDREQAEETTQDVFVKAYRSLGTFRGDSKFSTWLYRVAYHKILDACAREKRRRDLSSPVSLEDLAEGSDQSTWAEILGRERKEILLQALANLTPEENSLMSLFYLQELSLAEIAEVLDTSAGVVKVRLFRARERLKKMMQEGATGQLLKTYER
jgi:RNA polymerase sigma-70 factor (ECF subfamily)